MSRIKRSLKEIGYRGDLLVEDYDYTDLRDPKDQVHNIDIACFAQFPNDYRNACVGVTKSNGLSGKTNVERHGALGAPMIFEVHRSGVGRWKIECKKDGLSARHLENIPLRQIKTTILKNREDWSPRSIQRAKGISLRDEPKQLDFVDLGNMDFLEGILHEKMDGLLKETIQKVFGLLKKGKKGEGDLQYVFRIVFRFLAAKVFRDRNHGPQWKSNDAREILASIEKHYKKPEFSNDPQLNSDIIDLIWSLMLDSFHFQNLSVDDLAYVYETSFITKEIRQEWGVHSTPSKIAEYLVRKLPFKDLPLNGRRVLEPCSGHCIFLVAAMRRLRELLPKSWKPEKKHAYLQDRLVGIEIDSFASEVGRLCLTLADYPNPDGWHIHEEDIFETPRFDLELQKADIVLCNPPFEKFTPMQRKQYGDFSNVYKPAEILDRVLSNPPSLLGFVLPQVFTDGGSYTSFHNTLARNYENIEMISLPDSVFTHADVDPMLLMAWNRNKIGNRVLVQCRDVRESEKEDFYRKDKEPVSREKTFYPTRLEISSLWVPRFSKTWDYLASYPKLGEFTTVHKGICWASEKILEVRGRKIEERYSEEPREGFQRGFSQEAGNLQQFSFRNHNRRYLSFDPELHYDKNYNFPWDRPKVVCTVARFERPNPWRVAAALDKEGLVFTKRCFAFWEKSDLSLLSILAILNSPLTNAFIYSHDKTRDNRIFTLKSLPIPNPQALHRENVEIRAVEFVRLLEEANGNWQPVEDKLQRALLELDAAILKAYDLPPALERELLDTFEGYERHTPFDFPKSYYPEGFESYFPLHEILSEDFENARAENVLKRIKPFNDERISEIISSLMEDHS